MWIYLKHHLQKEFGMSPLYIMSVKIRAQVISNQQMLFQEDMIGHLISSKSKQEQIDLLIEDHKQPQHQQNHSILHEFL